MVVVCMLDILVRQVGDVKMNITKHPQPIVLDGHLSAAEECMKRCGNAATVDDALPYLLRPRLHNAAEDGVPVQPPTLWMTTQKAIAEKKEVATFLGECASVEVIALDVTQKESGRCACWSA